MHGGWTRRATQSSHPLCRALAADLLRESRSETIPTVLTIGHRERFCSQFSRGIRARRRSAIPPNLRQDICGGCATPPGQSLRRFLVPHRVRVEVRPEAVRLPQSCRRGTPISAAWSDDGCAGRPAPCRPERSPLPRLASRATPPSGRGVGGKDTGERSNHKGNQDEM
jgi:hypothetical protein